MFRPFHYLLVIESVLHKLEVHLDANLRVSLDFLVALIKHKLRNIRKLLDQHPHRSVQRTFTGESLSSNGPAGSHCLHPLGAFQNGEDYGSREIF